MSAVISALRKALEVDPSDWEFRLALTEAYLEEGLEKEAASLLDEVGTA